MSPNTDGYRRDLLRSRTWQVVREIDVVPMIAQHARLRRLCDQLECCANRLPERVAILEAAQLSAELAKRLSSHAGAEEATLAMLFEDDGAAHHHVLLDRIRHRHAVDHLHAEDLRDALTAAATTMGPVRGELLGYMMRCLFDGCRQGIDFQEAAILMLASDRLTKTARATLRSSLTGTA